MDDCVTKPFTLKALAACLEQWLTGAAQAQDQDAPQSLEPPQLAVAPEQPEAPAPADPPQQSEAIREPETPQPLESAQQPEVPQQIEAPQQAEASQHPQAQPPTPAEQPEDDLFVPGPVLQPVPVQSSEPAEQPAPAEQPEPEPAAATQDTPVIDQSILEMLGEMGGDDAAGLVERVFGLYEAHAPDALQKIDQELTGGDREAIAQAAHALKSMSFNVGARRVGDACAALEAIARTDPSVALGPYAQAVAMALLEAIDRIKETQDSGLRRLTAADRRPA